MLNIEQQFKVFSLLPHQSEDLSRIQNAGDKVVYKAPLGTGKTVVGIYHTLLLLDGDKIKNATFVIPDYQLVPEYISNIQSIHSTNNYLIVCPEGKGRISKKSKKRKFVVDKSKYQGIVVDSEYVKQKFPEYNPYNVLLEFAKKADIIICHSKMFQMNAKIPKTDLLVIDDGDMMLRDTSIELFRWAIADEHLQTINEKFEIENWLRKAEKKNLDNLVGLLKYWIDTFHNVALLEAISIADNNRSWNKLINIPDKWKKEIEATQKKWYEESEKSLEILIKSASTKEYIERIINFKREYFKWILGELDFLESSLKKESSYPYELRRFVNLILNGEWIVKRVRHSNEFGYLQINMVNEANIEKIKQYSKLLWLSATSEPPFECEIVETKKDPNYKYKSVILTDKDNLVKVVKKLTNYNILIYSRSKSEMEKAITSYGGIKLNTDQLATLQIKKGIYHFYAGGNLTRGVNKLMDFDMFVVNNYHYRDAKYDDSYNQNVFNDTYQAIGRVLRGDRNKVCLTDDDRLFNHLKDRGLNWNMIVRNGIDDTIKSVKELTNPLPVKENKEKRLPELKKGKIGRNYVYIIPKGFNCNDLPDIYQMK